MSPSLKPKSSGFSLIELMIGLVILAIAMAVGMPSYSQWIQNSQIRNAAESLQNGMQRARAEAVSRNINIAFTLGGGPFWAITQVNTGEVIESRPAAEISRTVSFVISPIAVAPATAPTTITFSNLGTVVANADATPTITRINIDSTALAAADSRDLSITIGVGGVVRMCDPNVVATTDPRHC